MVLWFVSFLVDMAGQGEAKEARSMENGRLLSIAGCWIEDGEEEGGWILK